jgi:pimeloyl-ACP methyl ester carboxylesterase
MRTVHAGTRSRMLAAGGLAAALAWAAWVAPPQASAEQASSPRVEQMRGVLAAVDAARAVSTADAERMLSLLETAEAEGLSAADRRTAVTELYRELWRFRGFDVEADAAALNRSAATAAAMLGFGARFSLDGYGRPVGGPDGRIGVVKRGTGPVPLVLVSDTMLPAEELYGSFMTRNADRYTMYAVTLPGIGQTRVPPRPAAVDYSKLPWLNAAEREILDLLNRENLRNAVVLGTGGGAYFSAALGARHPDRIRAAVVVNGLMYAPLRSPADPNRPATLEERLAAARRSAPIELTPLFWPPVSRDAFRALIENPPQGTGWGNPMGATSRDTERTIGWALDAFTPEGVWRQSRYLAELGATDLTSELMRLKPPLLVMASIHDHGSPGLGGSVIGQWTELTLRAPQAPVTIATFADIRNYVQIDAPDRFEEVLADFLAGRTPLSTTERAPAALPSPFATTSVYVGASELKVQYYRPAVRGRKIWGALVPYDRLWRTGANDAPMITFSHDVTVEGRPLGAGTYTLFTVPGDTAWTIVFNRIPWQFGTFAHDPAFDALRVTVSPEAAEMREYFEIAAEPTGAAEAVVTLRWERLAVPFTIALAAR